MTRYSKRLMLATLVIAAAGFVITGWNGAAYGAANGGSSGNSGSAPGHNKTTGAPSTTSTTLTPGGTSGSTGSLTDRGTGVPANSNNAPGNKGHIQIEGTFDCGTAPCGQDNDPHVSCTFTVELFGFGSGTNSAAITIRGQQPSGTSQVLSDSFSFQGNSSPNGSLLDTYRTYTPPASGLAGLTSKPKQGYHLRVEVAVNGHHAKTHVIWLGPCATGPGSDSGASTGDTTGANTGDTSGDTTGGTRGLAGQTTGSEPDSSALFSTAAPGSAVYASDVPVTLAGGRGDSAAPASSGLAFTGLDVIAVVAGAAVLLVVGLGFVVLSRRAKRVST